METPFLVYIIFDIKHIPVTQQKTLIFSKIDKIYYRHPVITDVRGNTRDNCILGQIKPTGTNWPMRGHFWELKSPNLLAG